MICSRCGDQDPVVREYCVNCGAKIDFTSSEHLAALMDQKKEERKRFVFARLSRLLAGAVALLIILFGLKAAFTWIPHEPVEAYVPPPRVDIIHSQKLSIQTPRLPAPAANERGRHAGKEEELAVKDLRRRALSKAPRFRLGGANGKIIQGFIIKRHGDAVTIFTEEGPSHYPASSVTKLD
jgi:hypothetical protein